MITVRLYPHADKPAWHVQSGERFYTFPTVEAAQRFLSNPNHEGEIHP